MDEKKSHAFPGEMYACGLNLSKLINENVNGTGRKNQYAQNYTLISLKSNELKSSHLPQWVNFLLIFFSRTLFRDICRKIKPVKLKTPTTALMIVVPQILLSFHRQKVEKREGESLTC